MTRDIQTEEDLTVDETSLNPAGAARRRLIKSLGLAAVASRVAIDWRKPQIHLGGLPAHAAGSPRLCQFNLSMTFAPSGTNPITLQIVGETITGGITVNSLYSTVVSDSSFTDEIATTLPIGDNELFLYWNRSQTSDEMDYEMSASCCDATADSSGGIDTISPQSGDERVFLVAIGDGTCSFPR